MRFGVVGAGSMGAIYAHCLNNLVQGASLGGVTGGTRAPALASTHGVSYAPTLEALLARDDIDAVALTSPTQAHLSQTLAAAAAGKHVFVEKPMAVGVEDCDAMIQACGAAGVELAVNSVTRYRRGVRQAKDLVDQGAIGTIRMIRHTYSWILTDYSGGKSWTVEPGAGSPFLDQGAHCNDVLRWFTGSEPVLCLAQYASYGSAPPPNQSAMVTYRFENGVMADLWASYEFPSPGLGRRGWTIDYMFVGSDGIIDVEYYGSLRLGRGDTWETLYEHPVVDIIRDPLDPNRMYPYADQLQDFVDALAAGRRPLVTGEDGRAGIEMAVAADIAAATNQAVKLPLSSGR